MNYTELFDKKIIYDLFNKKYFLKFDFVLLDLGYNMEQVKHLEGLSYTSKKKINER